MSFNVTGGFSSVSFYDTQSQLMLVPGYNAATGVAHNVAVLSVFGDYYFDISTIPGLPANARGFSGAAYYATSSRWYFIPGCRFINNTGCHSVLVAWTITANAGEDFVNPARWSWIDLSTTTGSPTCASRGFRRIIYPGTWTFFQPEMMFVPFDHSVPSRASDCLMLVDINGELNQHTYTAVNLTQQNYTIGAALSDGNFWTLAPGVPRQGGSIGPVLRFSRFDDLKTWNSPLVDDVCATASSRCTVYSSATLGFTNIFGPGLQLPMVQSRNGSLIYRLQANINFGRDDRIDVAVDLGRFPVSQQIVFGGGGLARVPAQADGDGNATFLIWSPQQVVSDFVPTLPTTSIPISEASRYQAVAYSASDDNFYFAPHRGYIARVKNETAPYEANFELFGTFGDVLATTDFIYFVPGVDSESTAPSDLVRYRIGSNFASNASYDSFNLNSLPGVPAGSGWSKGVIHQNFLYVSPGCSTNQFPDACTNSLFARLQLNAAQWNNSNAWTVFNITQVCATCTSFGSGAVYNGAMYWIPRLEDGRSINLVRYTLSGAFNQASSWSSMALPMQSTGHIVPFINGIAIFPGSPGPAVNRMAVFLSDGILSAMDLGAGVFQAADLCENLFGLLTCTDITAAVRIPNGAILVSTDNRQLYMTSNNPSSFFDSWIQYLPPLSSSVPSLAGIAFSSNQKAIAIDGANALGLNFGSALWSEIGVSYISPWQAYSQSSGFSVAADINGEDVFYAPSGDASATNEFLIADAGGFGRMFSQTVSSFTDSLTDNLGSFGGVVRPDFTVAYLCLRHPSTAAGNTTLFAYDLMDPVFPIVTNITLPALSGGCSGMVMRGDFVYIAADDQPHVVVYDRTLPFDEPNSYQLINVSSYCAGFEACNGFGGIVDNGNLMYLSPNHNSRHVICIEIVGPATNATFTRANLGQQFGLVGRVAMVVKQDLVYFASGSNNTNSQRGVAVRYDSAAGNLANTAAFTSFNICSLPQQASSACPWYVAAVAPQRGGVVFVPGGAFPPTQRWAAHFTPAGQFTNPSAWEMYDFGSNFFNAPEIENIPIGGAVMSEPFMVLFSETSPGYGGRFVRWDSRRAFVQQNQPTPPPMPTPPGPGFGSICNQNMCMQDWMCDPNDAAICVNGECRRAGWNDTCADGRCASPFACRSGVCLYAAEGCTCTSSNQCSDPYLCSGGRCSLRTQAEGESCTGDAQCRDGLYCDHSNTRQCATLKSLSSSCQMSEECASKNCDNGTCQPPRLNGASCDNNNQLCNGNYTCNNNECVLFRSLATNASCDSDDACASGFCQNDRCIVVRQRQLGQSCDSWSECPIGSRCLCTGTRDDNGQIVCVGRVCSNNATVGGAFCENQLDCPDDHYCDLNQCVRTQRVPINGNCRDSTDCFEGSCDRQSNRCVRDMPCRYDYECSPLETCSRCASSSELTCQPASNSANNRFREFQHSCSLRFQQHIVSANFTPCVFLGEDFTAEQINSLPYCRSVFVDLICCLGCRDKRFLIDFFERSFDIDCTARTISPPTQCTTGVVPVRLSNCVAAPTPAPTFLPPRCPPNRPFECTNGTCVATSADCAPPANTCPVDRPFYCELVDSCVESALACRNQSTNNCGSRVQCWNGECAQSLNRCPPVDSCPGLSVRCPDTTCTANLSSCAQGATCNGVTCPDGTCQPSASQCAPFNGCPVGRFRCADDTCVTDRQACLCPGATTVKCWDNSCRASQAACPLPPSALKITPVTLAIGALNVRTTFNISGATANATILSLTVPPNAFVARTTPCSFALNLRPLSDSEVNISVAGSTKSQKSGGFAVTIPSCARLNGTIEFCVRVASGTSRDGGMCLAFANEDVSPPQWRCQDTQLVVRKDRDGNDLFCGETDHFTFFAISDILDPVMTLTTFVNADSANTLMNVNVLIATLVAMLLCLFF